MRVAFFGTSSFIGSIQDARLLTRLIAGGIVPSVIITAPDGTQAKLKGTIKSAAEESGVPVLQPTTLKGFSEELEKFELDLSIVAAYGKILPAILLSVPTFGSLNIHPSLLPRYRGTTPIQATIQAGDDTTGVTIIHMDELMDHGPIVAQRAFSLKNKNWHAPELSEALADLGAELLIETIPLWLAGHASPRAQDETQATFTKMLKKEDGHIEWAKGAHEIERMVRALKPWPGSYAFWQHNGNQVRLMVMESNIGPTLENAEPVGSVGLMSGAVGVNTGSGTLHIERLQLEGGREMSAVDFLRGHPDIIGSVLT